MNAVRHSVLAPMSITAAILVVTLAGCGGDRLVMPQLHADAELEATLVRLPDGSVSVHAVATNTGNVPIIVSYSGSQYNRDYCALIGITVRSPQGEIRRFDPCGPHAIPLCAAPDPIKPGERLERTFLYDGTQYGDTCNSLHTIPPGSYEVVAAFNWHTALGEPRTSIARFLPFDWPAP